jgi:hypothetical protein
MMGLAVAGLKAGPLQIATHAAGPCSKCSLQFKQLQIQLQLPQHVLPLTALEYVAAAAASGGTGWHYVCHTFMYMNTSWLLMSFSIVLLTSDAVSPLYFGLKSS